MLANVSLSHASTEGDPSRPANFSSAFLCSRSRSVAILGVLLASAMAIGYLHQTPLRSPPALSQSAHTSRERAPMQRGCTAQQIFLVRRLTRLLLVPHYQS